ncbi:hypothetical protein Tco_1400008 [Tanacetum coccineum]
MGSSGSSSNMNDEALARLMVSELATHNERTMTMKKDERLAFLDIRRREVDCRERELAMQEYKQRKKDMTTTVVNNSVFRGFFEKQRLTGPNFIDWYRNLWIVLSVEDKLPFLEHPIPAMPVPPTGQVLPSDVLATHTAWSRLLRKLLVLCL